MGARDPESQLKPPEPPKGDRLEGWKEIAAHLKREVRTVQRWEKTEALPVHRHQHDKLGTVWAYKSEIEAWLGERQPQQDEVEPEAKDLEPDVEELIQPLPPRPRIRLSQAVLVLLVLAAAAYGVWILTHRVIGRRPKVMLAVLPLDNLSGDPAQEYFSDGLSDEMITQLSRLNPEKLGVISWTTARAYKHTKKTAAQVGHELAVDYIVEGSVTRDGDRVRIRAQLIEVRDQTHLWAQSYARSLSDVLGLQNEVAQAIASEIQVKLEPGRHERLPAVRAVNPDAYDAYLKGRFFWNKRYEAEDALKRSLGYFQDAIERDPNFSLAYTGLADSYSLLGSNALDALPPLQARTKAKQAAERALQLDDTLAEAHASLGSAKLNFEWDFPGAEREFKRAIDLNANYATAHQWYGSYLLAMGRLDEAVQEGRRARELDPYAFIINVDLAWKLYMARRYDDSIKQCRDTAELDPDLFLTYYILGMAYEQKRMYPEAIAEFEKGKKLSKGGPIMLMALGHAYAVSGNNNEAHRMLTELQRVSARRYVPALYFAAVYTGLGDKNQAFHWLDKALEEHSEQFVYLKAEPMADSLRSDPRFKEVLRRIGLPP